MAMDLNPRKSVLSCRLRQVKAVPDSEVEGRVGAVLVGQGQLRGALEVQQVGLGAGTEEGRRRRCRCARQRQQEQHAEENEVHDV